VIDVDAPPPAEVLVVDDEEVIRGALGRVVTHAGGTADFAETSARARELIGDRDYAIALLDKNLPDGSGIDILAFIKQTRPRTEVLIITGYGNMDSAIEALRLGAFDYIVKPFDVQAFTHRLQHALERRRMLFENARMQSLLLSADRMASVGTLAAGVAHEINNPLAFVLANLGYLADGMAKLKGRDVPSDVKARLTELEEVVREARGGAERVRLIVRDLRTFARGDDDRRGQVDLRRVVDTALSLAWPEIRHRAKVVKDFEDVALITANESRLVQVFVNLLVNAAQAIQDGAADKNEIKLTIRRRGAQVDIDIADTGVGIADDIVAQLFDPFFTTRPAGEGTGLGLSVCHGIVKSLGGDITVESAVGKGSRFRVSLPVGEDADAAVTPSPDAKAARRGRVVVIDDEPLIGTSVRRLLSPEHDVLSLTRGQALLDRLAVGERYDLILCDIMMPELSGMDVYEQIKKLSPEEADRLVFVTGGAYTARTEEFLKQVGNVRIEKPFDAAKLRSLLASRLKA
jgi:signal transduction histidine kinase